MRHSRKGVSFFMVEIALIILVIILGIREYVSYTERKDLLDRLMARNLPEYKEYSAPEEPNHLEEETTEIPLEDARALIEKELRG